jgi:hypothetical protein
VMACRATSPSACSTSTERGRSTSPPRSATTPATRPAPGHLGIPSGAAAHERLYRYQENAGALGASTRSAWRPGARVSTSCMNARTHPTLRTDGAGITLSCHTRCGLPARSPIRGCARHRHRLRPG